METLTDSTVKSVVDGIVESSAYGLVLLSPAHKKPVRRLIYLDSYGGASMWEKIKKGDMPPHHLRGCLELVRMGYEVALAEPLTDFYLYRNPFPHDLKMLKIVRNWLGPDGIVFCGHNVLYWLLFLKKLGFVRCHIVSHLWAREPLNFAKFHSGILALTPAGAEQARKLAPKVPMAQLGWGADLGIYPQVPYDPQAFFSCGIALRDFKTLSLAAAKCNHAVKVICPGEIEGVTWSANVEAINSGKGWNFEKKRLTYQELLENYAKSIASLLILKKDPIHYTAIGFTEVIEALAMARPVIMTRTGALPTQIDVEKEGCGVYVPPENPEALTEAMNFIAGDQTRAQRMGEKARKLAEEYYNIERYARDLHRFFANL
jgi:hypothetical protein